MRFSNRIEAGQRLARELARFASRSPVVIGLPRGGVPVAAEVARGLNAPLDVCVVRKVGVPGAPEFGMGAVAEGGFQHLNEDIIREVGVTAEEVEEKVHEKQREVEDRVQRFRRGQYALPVEGRTVILVDDGIATGGTVRAAILALRARDPDKIVLAVPVAAVESLETLRAMVDETVCLIAPSSLLAIGAWYDDFAQVDDSEVIVLLDEARARVAGGAAAQVEEEIEIPCEGVVLRGMLAIPPGAPGLVVFAHGSGSSRHSPRNRRVAEVLRRSGLATLLFDLLSESEEALDEVSAEFRFDIPLLAQRLVGVTEWVHREPRTRAFHVGYFGASTGAAAALVAAAARPRGVEAIVSRGGRPDLAQRALGEVRAPALFIVGELDPEVMQLNREAAAAMAVTPELVTVPGATHLFEEPGTLDQVARLAAEFFSRHLSGRPVAYAA